MPPQPVVVPPQQVVEVIPPFIITSEIKGLTDELKAVLAKQEKVLKKFKEAWLPPNQAEIIELDGLYKAIHGKGQALASQLQQHLKQHEKISLLIQQLTDLCGKANLGSKELEPIVKNGVLRGGVSKMFKSKEKELQRGFDFCNEWRAKIQQLLDLPAHKA